ncbi:MAG: MarC family protein [Candidatus Aceula meridiana]|nr:MarC family protein [Candidatus Aceula meridiana]
MNVYLNCTLALLALINPLSKIFVVHTISQGSDEKGLTRILVKASLIAMAILVIFTFGGNFFLKYVFHVDIYAFQMVGGLVLLLRGMQALNRGLFFETEANQKLEDASIVPLASPMIAGPATITAAISFPSQYGLAPTIFAIILGIAINLFLMTKTRMISNILIRFNLMGALIRITGLIVATIGAQMILDGIVTYSFVF